MHMIPKDDHSHDQAHSHDHEHDHSHQHEHKHDVHELENKPHEHKHEHHIHKHKPHHLRAKGSKILTIRASSGLSGDMFLAGLACMAELSQSKLDEFVEALNIPALQGCVQIKPKSVNQVLGMGCEINLPHEHSHRSFTDISQIIEANHMTVNAKALALKAFSLLAEAEAAVHGKSMAEVSFHEVGALDSILDMCLVCMLYDYVQPEHTICSPLPLSDGGIYCAHGWLPSPAPAVLKLLENVPVCGFAGHGETLTPTALALLKALEVDFGPWPEMRINKQALIYGGKVFENAPNGVIFALGTGL